MIMRKKVSYFSCPYEQILCFYICRKRNKQWNNITEVSRKGLARFSFYWRHRMGRKRNNNRCLTRNMFVCFSFASRRDGLSQRRDKSQDFLSLYLQISTQTDTIVLVCVLMKPFQSHQANQSMRLNMSSHCYETFAIHFICRKKMQLMVKRL